MKKIFVIIWIVTLIFPVIAYCATVNILDYDISGVTVEIEIDTLFISPQGDVKGEEESRIRIPGFEEIRYEGYPVLPARRYLFEVTSRKGVGVRVIENNKRVLDGVKPVIFNADDSLSERLVRKSSGPAANTTSDFVTLAGVGDFRKTPIALIDIRPVIFDKENEELLYSSRIVFRLTFPKAQVSGREGVLDMPRDRFIANAEQAKLWRKKSRPFQSAGVYSFEFSLADEWVKIRVEDPGIYEITYSDLYNSGVNPADIDPSDIRLFSNPARINSARPFQQPADIDSGGSFETDYHMSEHAIKFLGNSSDGTFDPGESVIFYGVGVEGWRDYLDPGADRYDTFDNIYETRNVYWMAWSRDFEGIAKRMDSRDVSPSHDGSLETINTYEHRLHIEEDNEYSPVLSNDRWLWKNLASNISGSYTDYFIASDIAESNCKVRTIGLIRTEGGAADCYLNSENVGRLEWKYPFYITDTLVAEAATLNEGENSFKYDKVDDEIEMNIYWYEIFFDRYLITDPSDNFLDFFAPEASAAANFVLRGFPDEERFIFDVSDYTNPVILAGADSSADTISFDDSFSPSSNHYFAVSESSIRKASIEYVRNIPSLRDETSSPAMLVIYNDIFSQSARQFAAYRAEHFPETGSGYVKAVDIEDVYNNFSGGLKDPIAIRNYLKFLYDNYSENGDPVIEYVFLIGKGNYDPKDIMGRGEDFIPYYFDGSMEFDDYLVKLDEGGDLLIDLSIGRLPAIKENNAVGFFNKLLGYESSDNYGSWKNKVVFVADDEISSNSNTDTVHMSHTEGLSRGLSARQDYLDITEIYLHDYPTVNSLKPEATADLMKEWNEGALIVNYIGHGSSVQLADELVMSKNDIYSLNNENRLPLFLGFSCSVGELDHIFTKSLAHELVLAEGKGAIASISAVTYSYSTWNRDLDLYFLDNIFPDSIHLGTQPVGRALLFAKTTEISDEWNNRKYTLIGDPATKLILPELMVEHAIDDVDTLSSGYMYNLKGSVISDGEIYTAFNGTADIVIRDARRQFNALGVEYDHSGSVLFRGTADVSSGEFNSNFVVPLRCHYGIGGEISSYVSSGSSDGAGICDTLVVLKGDSVMENDGPPIIDMYFENNATKVKSGSKLVVEIEDENGIAIIGTDPQNSILLEFDDNGYPIYVTDYFEYNYGSYTSGVVEYFLQSEFERGSHSVIAKVFDNMGVMSSDTLQFEIVEEGLYRISDIFNFPNPFSENTNFVFQLSGGAEINLKVFTVSGVEIWRRELVCSEGYNSISWDGRDKSGNRLANGTYLYVLDAEFDNSLNRSETAEGKVILMR